jgi:hypothetical protein
VDAYIIEMICHYFGMETNLSTPTQNIPDNIEEMDNDKKMQWALEKFGDTFLTSGSTLFLIILSIADFMVPTSSPLFSEYRHLKKTIINFICKWNISKVIGWRCFDCSFGSLAPALKLFASGFYSKCRGLQQIEKFVYIPSDSTSNRVPTVF